MSRNQFIFLIIFVSVVIVAAAFSVKQFALLQKGGQEKAPTTTPKTTSSQFQANQGVVTLPVNPKQPPVRAVSIAYRFDGMIKEIARTDDNIELLTTIQGEGIPKIVFDENTEVFTLQDDNSLKIAPVSELKPNQNIQVNAFYRLINKKWSIHRVIIVPDATASAKTR